MTKEELQKLYKEKILPENNSPFHFDCDPNADHTITAYNPMCGDKFQLYLGADSNHFDGFGCAVSKASTSLLMRNIEGKTRQEIKTLCSNFLAAFETGKGEELSEELQILLELKNFDGRLECIQLSWKALNDFLE